MPHPDPPSGTDLIQASTTAIGRMCQYFLHHELSTGRRIFLIVAFAIIANVMVRLVEMDWKAVLNRRASRVFL